MRSEALADANIILRLLTDDPPHLAHRAARLIQASNDRDDRVVLTSVTVAEIVYVLDSLYGWSRSDIATRLLELFDSSLVYPLEHRTVVQTLLLFRNTPAIHFADAYLVASAESRGSAIMSFDRDFRQVPGITLLDATEASDPL